MALERGHDSRRGSYDICAAVVGDLAYDARVWKEAKTLCQAGWRVKLIGCRYELTRTKRYRDADGIDVVEIPIGTRASASVPRDRARTLLTLWAEVARTRAAVFHAHNIHVVPACWAASKVRHAALVFDAHELYGCAATGDGAARRALHAFARVVEGAAVARADRVITTNPSRVIALQARHGMRDIETLANVPTLVEQVTPKDPGFPPGVEVLLYQGGIYARERPFRETIRALALLPEHVHFVIVGFGHAEQISLIRGWAQEHGVAHRVHLIDALPFDELVDTAAAATVGIVPLKAIDLNYRLGDTNKLHEYLMAGLPVVASDLPEVARVVRQGEPPVGELFNGSQPDSIAAAYRRVIDNREGLYERRRVEARRLAVQSHNWAIEGDRLINLYRTLLPPR